MVSECVCLSECVVCVCTCLCVCMCVCVKFACVICVCACVQACVCLCACVCVCSGDMGQQKRCYSEVGVFQQQMSQTHTQHHQGPAAPAQAYQCAGEKEIWSG